MSLLSAAAETLRRQHVPHAVIGALAMAARGVSRATLDADLLVTDPVVLEAGTWRGLEGKGVTVDLRPGEEDDPLAGMVSLAFAEEEVDLVVGRWAWQEEVIGRAEPLPLGDAVLPVARTADLVLLKLFAGGPQDAWDIHQLLALEGREAVVAELEPRLGVLPAEARALWQRLRAERG